MRSETAFSGFPEEGLAFYQALAANNNREWFQAHKQDYIDYVQAPAVAFIMTLGERLKTLSDGIRYDTRTNGAGSLLRIYRDIRFSKDKTPYKTNLGIILWQGEGKKTECPAFYFHMEADAGQMHCGMHHFGKPMLAAYRDAVIDDKMGAELEDALAKVKGAGSYRIGGEHYKQVPRGYDPAHRRVGLLLYNGLSASAPPLAPSLVTSPDLVEVCFQQCRDMAPLFHWLVKLYRQAG